MTRGSLLAGALAALAVAVGTVDARADAGVACSSDGECASQLCVAGACAACGDGCPDESPCDRAGNCASGVCTAGSCAPPACAPSCADGASCGADGDCSSGSCIESFCACTSMCSPGTKCASSATCASANCVAGQCQAAGVPLGCARGYSDTTPAMPASCALACAALGAFHVQCCQDEQDGEGMPAFSPVCCPADAGATDATGAADGGVPTCPGAGDAGATTDDAGPHLESRDAAAPPVDAGSDAAADAGRDSGERASSSASSRGAVDGGAASIVGTPNSGCGCRVARSGSSLPLPALLTLAMAALVRRKKRPRRVDVDDQAR